MITGTRYRASVEIARQGRLAQTIARAQSDISTGVRISVPSDDPIAAARVSQIRLSQADQEVWSRNIETAKSIAGQADNTMTGVADLYDRVKELTLSGASGSASPSDRLAVVQELRELKDVLGSYITAKTPTGQDLFPVDAPLRISVSGTLHLPATAKRSTVFENVAVPSGTSTLADIIDAAANAVALDDATARRAAADASMNDIDAAVVHIASQRSSGGVRAAQLDSAFETLITNGELLTEERSSLEDTDVAATVMRLNAKTLSLQAAQAAFARINRNTLFDILS